MAAETGLGSFLVKGLENLPETPVELVGFVVLVVMGVGALAFIFAWRKKAQVQMNTVSAALDAVRTMTTVNPNESVSGVLRTLSPDGTSDATKEQLARLAFGSLDSSRVDQLKQLPDVIKSLSSSDSFAAKVLTFAVVLLSAVAALGLLKSSAEVATNVQIKIEKTRGDLTIHVPPDVEKVVVARSAGIAGEPTPPDPSGGDEKVVPASVLDPRASDALLPEALLDELKHWRVQSAHCISVDALGEWRSPLRYAQDLAAEMAKVRGLHDLEVVQLKTGLVTADQSDLYCRNKVDGMKATKEIFDRPGAQLLCEKEILPAMRASEQICDCNTKIIRYCDEEMKTASSGG